MKKCILVADDEFDVRRLVGSSLRNAGFATSDAEDGAAALAKAREEKPALIILDLMMPRLSGFDVCKLLKRDPDTERIPILMLTAKTDEIDRILGMELGADDYVTKPFSPRELVLRVQSILRRAGTGTINRRVVELGPIQVDIDRHSVTVNDRAVDLTAIEFKLLRVLMEAAGKVLGRDVLLAQVWGQLDSLETRTVDTHIRRLRDKLGSAATLIQTVRSFGYRFDPEPDHGHR